MLYSWFHCSHYSLNATCAQGPWVEYRPKHVNHVLGYWVQGRFTHANYTHKAAAYMHGHVSIDVIHNYTQSIHNSTVWMQEYRAGHIYDFLQDDP